MHSMTMPENLSQVWSEPSWPAISFLAGVKKLETVRKGVCKDLDGRQNFKLLKEQHSSLRPLCARSCRCSAFCCCSVCWCFPEIALNSCPGSFQFEPAARAHPPIHSVPAAMPGGLAAWLNDDTSPKHRKKGSTNNGASASRLTPRALPRPIRKPLAAAAAAAEALHSPSGTSAIDVDAAVPDVATRLEKTAAFPRTSTGTTARAKMSSGHPLSCSDTCNNTSADSGLPRRLLKRVASSSKVIGITQGRDSPPTPEPASSWDPFESGDGKENSTNAFSMLLAPRKAGGGGFGARSALAVGKRKRPVGWSPHRAAAMAEAAGAATSFCECPVCGKRVSVYVHACVCFISLGPAGNKKLSSRSVAMFCLYRMMTTCGKSSVSYRSSVLVHGLASILYHGVSFFLLCILCPLQRFFFVDKTWIT